MKDKRVARLEKDLFEIETPKGSIYGGDQTLFDNTAISASGCGIIGAANLLCHVANKTPTQDEYNKMCKELYKKYIRVSRRFGITGIGLAWGINRAFKAYGLPYRAAWCCSLKKLWMRVDAMLENDIPVIISAGPALPWCKKSAVTLLSRKGNALVKAAAMKSHYVTATAANDDLLCVSSWGKKYYIKKEDFCRYAKKHSLPLFCNVLFVKRLR